MARSRNIKPGFFANDELAEIEPLGRLLFAGLWTIADREGRLEDRPKKIKAEILPYDPCDAEALLALLAARGFLLRYEIDGARYIQIANFLKHQQPHYKELPSAIPEPPGWEGSGVVTFGVSNEQRDRILARDQHKCVECGETAFLQIDHIVPRTRGGSGDDDNLQVLCRRCNAAKGNRDRSGASNDGRPIIGQSLDDVGQYTHELAPPLTSLPGTRNSGLDADSLQPGSRRRPDELAPPRHDDSNGVSGQSQEIVQDTAKEPPWSFSLADLSEPARGFLDAFRVAYGSKRPMKLNPTQVSQLEEAVLDLGPERLEESATWAASQGLDYGGGSVIKAIRAARTKRQKDEDQDYSQERSTNGRSHTAGRQHTTAAGDDEFAVFAQFDGRSHPDRDGPTAIAARTAPDG